MRHFLIERVIDHLHKNIKSSSEFSLCISAGGDFWGDVFSVLKCLHPVCLWECAVLMLNWLVLTVLFLC